MRTYRYKVQTSAFGLFLGIGAEVHRSQDPPAIGHRAGTRVWLDASNITDTFRGKPLLLNEHEIDWLLAGLRTVADEIESIETTGHILITVRALEIVETDYDEVALAPAVAEWAAAEFGLAPGRGRITRDTGTGRYRLEWNA
ncbi:hypothetical protein KGA66_26765 [Actinocrinis puniceicyclus]|uniref:Uncharacterized protein n=1 Tax=Actinocrinis puniceicyclus TaxID=977794 RepID=A0A8J8BER7_9ACTN|nr:hypothetical protein [Actinocrinis puniceicyclus]MBS2966668.1 hypothetical protein [Actinocrinis puniceicyclus]